MNKLKVDADLSSSSLEQALIDSLEMFQLSTHFLLICHENETYSAACAITYLRIHPNSEYREITINPLFLPSELWNDLDQWCLMPVGTDKKYNHYLKHYAIYSPGA